MQLFENNFIVIERDRDKEIFRIIAKDIRDQHFQKEINIFNDLEESQDWIKQNYKDISTVPNAYFSDNYVNLLENINLYLKQKLTEQRLSMLFTKSGKSIENIELLGISVDREQEGKHESVNLLNHHFFVDTGEKVYMSHQIIFDCPEKENEIDISQFDDVIPLFQQGSSFDLNGYVVSRIERNPFSDIILASGIGKETFKKLKQNDVEDDEMAAFLETIQYPKQCKFKTDWSINIKKEYQRLLKKQ